MENILFICNTHYQLIVAMQMRLTVKAHKNAYVLITNRSKGAKEVAARLEEAKLFEKVFYHEIKDPKKKTPSFSERLFYIKSGIFGNKMYRTDKDIVFDEIIGFNLDLHSHIVFANEHRKNKHIRCEKMEEGLLSLGTKDDSSGILSTVYNVRKILHWTNMRPLCSYIYCFQPRAYNGKLTPKEIKRISSEDKRLKDILTAIFKEDTQNKSEYKEKYIYLPCVYDFEGGSPIGELETALKIAEKVGKDNLLVKVHPRDDVQRYINAGLKVDCNSKIPWEVIQINHDFSDKILLSTLSTSLLTTATLFDNPPVCYYVFPLCDLSENSLSRHYKGVIEGYLKNSEELGIKNVNICDNLENLS